MDDRIEIFKAIFDQMPNACVVYDPAAGKIIAQNAAFQLIFEQGDQTRSVRDIFLSALHPGFSDKAFEEFLNAPLAGHVSLIPGSD